MSEANSEPEPNTAFGAAPTRRTILRTAGLIALAGGTAAAAAACAADNEIGATPTATASGQPSASASPSSATPTSSASSPTESSAGTRKSASKPPTGPSVATSKVPVGGGVILDNADYVVTQPSKGTFKAFDSTCTHMSCKVAEVAGGVIHCNCHGSEFSIKDGSVVNPPASTALAEHQVTVSGGKVYVT